MFLLGECVGVGVLFKASVCQQRFPLDPLQTTLVILDFVDCINSVNVQLHIPDDPLSV